jgi:hypothetical protein
MGNRAALALAAFVGIATPLWAEVRGVRMDTAYLAAGAKTVATVLLDGDSPKDSRILVSIIRDVDVPDAAGGPAGRRMEELSNLLLSGTAEMPIEITGAGMLSGTFQIKAEVMAPGEATPSSVAWSAPVQVGVRPRVSLAGSWDVVRAEPLTFENKSRPKTWKAPAFDRPVTLPGAVTDDEWFRGWVTLRRAVDWTAAGGARPRFLRLSGVSNSALARVNNEVAGEVQPVGELDCELSHWGEYHSAFKGPDNKAARQMMYDASVRPPMVMPLPKALPAAGRATVEMKLRGTSGAFQKKPPYGIFGDLHFELTQDVFIKAVTFDTEKPGEKRRFKFQLTVVNDTGAPFHGRVRTVIGRYEGAHPYTGACPAYADAEQEITLPVGETRVDVARDETPRFDTCRATFLLLGKDGRVLDAEAQDFHTVTVEIRDRRDLYLNNERFFIKARGSWGEDANSRLQLRAMGANGFRAHRPAPSRLYPGLWSGADGIDDRYKDGLLTSAGPLLASVEKCTFFDPADTSNITRAVQKVIRDIAQCPGIIDWEATNELHGEPEEARVAILEAFPKLDPYHRPVLATKGSGEWEAEAREGRVAGVDIVGVQYLLSREAVDSVTAAITEQPIMSTEVNWNDMALHGQNLWRLWLEKGVCGSLLFDYSGNALQQPVPLIAPEEKNQTKGAILDFHRQLYQDFQVAARRLPDGRVLLECGNRMPYALNDIVLRIRHAGRFDLPKLAPGDAVALTLPPQHSPGEKERVIARAEYTTHSGLKHFVLLTPTVTAAPATEGGKAK